MMEICASLLLFGCGNQEVIKEDEVKPSEIAETAEIAETTESIAETTSENQNEKALSTQDEEADVDKNSLETRCFFETIDSKSIANNKIGDTSKRNIFIYLPPSYNESDKSYPVVYFLHGYGDSSGLFIKKNSILLDKAFENKENKEFIMVVFDGNNKTGGSFYVNSPASGNWEDFVTKEVVEYIDTNYRTLAKSESRCISGYSMGGYGAINAALKHPDIYSAVMVFCPGIYKDGEIETMWKSWGGWNDVKESYAQAFSPSDDAEKKYGNIPEFSGTAEDNEIVKQWDYGYGCWESKINDYIALGTPLKAIQINYGKQDIFKWIPTGCQFFSSVLEKNNIEHELIEFNDGHIVPINAVDQNFVPFCNAVLEFE